MALAAVIPDQCEVFFYSPISPGTADLANNQIDAMWAGLRVNIPTVNGYSGYPPRGWWRTVHQAVGRNPRPGAEKNLTRGLAEAGATADSVCWIRAGIATNPVRALDVRVLTLAIGVPRREGTSAVSDEAAIFEDQFEEELAGWTRHE